jgi:two-component system OmpR family sensor kinase
MSKLLSRSLKRFISYAAIVLICSIPVYYFIISELWQFELREHNIILTEKAGREDSFLIIGTITILTVLFFGLLLIGMVLLNRRLSRNLWRPFYDSLSKIKDFDLNRNQTIHFDPTDITEFAELNANLNKLITGSISTYNRQKEFADNASHELQTPLAIVQSKLDLLLQSRSLTDEQYHIIEDAHQALTRVGRINKNLLLLTRIGNSQYSDEAALNLSAMVETTKEEFYQFADAKQLSIQTEIQQHIAVKGNKDLVEILVRNLLNNAIRHSKPQGVLLIQLKQHSLHFSNEGVKPLNQEQLFKRFGTVSPETPGTGLGLALVKQISDRYDWKIVYRFEDNRHIFSLYF